MTALVGLCHAEEKAPELPEYVLPTVRNWLSQNSEVVDVCVFREQWTAPTEEIPKGMLTKFATITRVHKGSVKVGDRVMLSALVEYSSSEWKREARIRASRVSMVDGELMVCMFNKIDTPHKDGYWDLGDGITRFVFDSPFHRAYLIEKKQNPDLKGAPN